MIPRPIQPTFALPHLGGNADADAAARKRQYGRDLQEQVQENLRRKGLEGQVLFIWIFAMHRSLFKSNQIFQL
jgi:hypothetical protein